MGLLRRRITEDTDLEQVSTGRLLKEHRRRVLAEAGPDGAARLAGTYGLTSDIEDVLDRRGVGYPSAEEILGGGRGSP